MASTRLGLASLWTGLMLGVWGASGSAARPGQEQAAAWRADLATIHEELKGHHPNPFHDLPEEEFRAALESLGDRLDGLSRVQFAVELQRILASLKESHTGISGWFGAFPAAPVRFALLSDGIFVAAVDREHAGLLGGKVVRFGSVPAGEALERLTSTISADNDHWPRAVLPLLARMPRLLHALDMGGTPECLSLEVERRDGEAGQAEVCAGRDGVPLAELAGSGPASPVSMQDHSGRIYWHAAVPSGKAIYVRYDSCREDPDLPFARFTEDLMAEIDRKEIQTVVLDLRRNSGGSSVLARPLIQALSSHPRLGRDGSVRVLVGPMTVSSAFINAMELKSEAGALLVGETMGQRPNHYGEVRTFELPGSGLRIQHSTKFHRMIQEADPDAVAPDIEVKLSPADLLEERDPVLEAALDRRVGGAKPSGG